MQATWLEEPNMLFIKTKFGVIQERQMKDLGYRQMCNKMTSDLSNNGYCKTLGCKKAEISSLRHRILVIPFIRARELKAPLNPPSYALGCISEGWGCTAGLSLPLH